MLLDVPDREEVSDWVAVVVSEIVKDSDERSVFDTDVVSDELIVGDLDRVFVTVGANV